MNVGRRLAKAREGAGLTQDRVGLLVGKTRQAVSRWENNEASPPLDSLALLANCYGVSVEYLINGVPHLPPGTWAADLMYVPVLGRIHAGDPHWAEHNVEDYSYIARNQAEKNEYFILRVEGDCMVPARILPGDLVVVRKQPAVEDGEIAVVWWNGQEEAHLRRIRRVDQQLLLMADNPSYPPLLVPPSEVTVLGKVVEVKFKPGKGR